MVCKLNWIFKTQPIYRNVKCVRVRVSESVVCEWIVQGKCVGVCAYELACVSVRLKIKSKNVVFQRTVIENENQYKFVCIIQLD